MKASLVAALMLSLLVTVSGCASPNPFVSDYRTHERKDYIGPRLQIEAGGRVIVHAFRDGYVSDEIIVDAVDEDGFSGSLASAPHEARSYRWDSIHQIDIARDTEHDATNWAVVLIVSGLVAVTVVDGMDDFFDSVFGDDDDD